MQGENEEKRKLKDSFSRLHRYLSFASPFSIHSDEMNFFSFSFLSDLMASELRSTDIAIISYPVMISEK